MQWMYYHKDLGKQINVMLLGGIVFVIFYYIFDRLGGYTTVFKGISLFCAAYLFVAALLFTKKWIDKKYK